MTVTSLYILVEEENGENIYCILAMFREFMLSFISNMKSKLLSVQDWIQEGNGYQTWITCPYRSLVRIIP